MFKIVQKDIALVIYLFLLNVYAETMTNASITDTTTDTVNGHGMEGKIVGGEAIPLEKVPYSVQIFNSGAMCSGTILNSWTLLTAAHCFDVNRITDDIVVQVGSRYVYDLQASQYYVSEIVTHHQYNHTGLFSCDIAMVFMESAIKFGTTAMKAILVNNNLWMNPKHHNFIVTGWGWTKYGGDISHKGLMMATMQYVPLQKCSNLHKLYMTPDMFCLYGNAEKDTCKGDSGGGVYWNRMMVGIVSHGDGCAKKDKPSVYANVYYFKDWIKEEMIKYLKKNCYTNIQYLRALQEIES